MFSFHFLRIDWLSLNPRNLFLIFTVGPSRQGLLEEIKNGSVDVVMASYHTLAADLKKYATFLEECASTLQKKRKTRPETFIFNLEFHRIVLVRKGHYLTLDCRENYIDILPRVRFMPVPHAWRELRSCKGKEFIRRLFRTIGKVVRKVWFSGTHHRMKRG